MADSRQQDDRHGDRYPKGRSARPIVYYAELSLGGMLRFLSHQQFSTCFARSTLRAGLPLAFSKGYNPRPKISLPVPKSVGMCCSHDLARFELTQSLNGEDIRGRLQRVVPKDVIVHRVWSTDVRSSPPARAVEWDIDLAGLDVDDLERRVRTLLECSTFVVKRLSPKRGKTLEYDLRRLILELRVEPTILHAKLAIESTVAVRPDELLKALGLPVEEGRARLTRTRIHWGNSQFLK